MSLSFSAMSTRIENKMVLVLMVVNLVGGAIALAAASVTDMPVRLTLPTHTTYIFGLFAVNGVHGVMHLTIGLLGFLVWAGMVRASRYFIGHTTWFALLSIWGFMAAPEWAPLHKPMGLAINFPDHVAHFVLAFISLLPLLLTMRLHSVGLHVREMWRVASGNVHRSSNSLR